MVSTPKSRVILASVIVAATLAVCLPCAAEKRVDKRPMIRPPRDAVLLFDGTNTDAWVTQGTNEPIKWKLVDGAMEVAGGNITTKEHFSDCQLHIEFMIPDMAEQQGQGRGNSGVYLQGSYEIQVLDSYGVEKLGLGDCGAVYGISPAKVNACKKPLEWQTYDITFCAPRFDKEGNKVENARMVKVYQNGILIQEDVEVPGPTTAAMPREYLSRPGPLMLQDHGCPVRYRNIWLVSLNDCEGPSGPVG